MARKKKDFPVIEGVTITGIAAEGKAIARIEDEVFFVPYCVPGDIVDLCVRKKHRNYCDAEVVKFIDFGSDRVQPKCIHFGVCGGCKWQHLSYSAQLRAKQQQVYDQLRRIGKIDLPEMGEIIGSSRTEYYRNKLEFGCSNRRWLTRNELSQMPINSTNQSATHANVIGFHVSGAFDKILPIEECHLMHSLHNRIRNAIRDYAIYEKLSFFDNKEQRGLLRDIVIRNSSLGEWMIILQFCFKEEGAFCRAEKLMNYLSGAFPKITSLMFVDNQKCNDTFGDLQVHTFKGRDYILEQMEELSFKVGPKSFYQTNTLQARVLYNVVKDMAALDGTQLVYDLYTGTGTIALFLSKKAKKVIGIEYVPEAVMDAKENAKINKIDNTEFVAGDMRKILCDAFIEENGRPDVIVTDPPRAGMHPDVIQTILRTAPKRIVYVSCNPATQARDLSLLDKSYRVIEVRPVDMFPHTPHVENVVLLKRREEL